MTVGGEPRGDGVLGPNDKFGSMKKLADHIHGKGLRFGIYSSPGPKSCGGYEGGFGHEEQDAKTFAAGESTISSTIGVLPTRWRRERGPKNSRSPIA